MHPAPARGLWGTFPAMQATVSQGSNGRYQGDTAHITARGRTARISAQHQRTQLAPSVAGFLSGG